MDITDPNRCQFLTVQEPFLIFYFKVSDCVIIKKWHCLGSHQKREICCVIFCEQAEVGRLIRVNKDRKVENKKGSKK
jgi:hypothetical protein